VRAAAHYRSVVLDPSPLSGRVALVTGAARGIGRAIAIGLAAAGADVAVADVHPDPFAGERYYRLRARVSGPEEGVSTADAVVALGRRAMSLAVDVSDASAVVDVVAACTSELGAPDILVNNAGIVNNIAGIADMTPEAWNHELQVNLSGMFHTVRATVPAMVERGWGRVINLSSIAALNPGLGQPAYAASKAGVIGFTKAVAQEFGPGGVTANAILPGLIATPLVRSMPDHLREHFVSRTPVARLGEPEDIAALAVFLASPAAGFISAVAIPCDGGVSTAAREGLDRPR
jgi:NAD(P)-dependent dehydrogenase (short-subunit alcohol dehydrogenase family)